MQTKKYQGFTFVEILVTIAIIGVLSTVVAVSIQNARIKAYDARRITDMKAVYASLEAYDVDNHGTSLEGANANECVAAGQPLFQCIKPINFSIVFDPVAKKDTPCVAGSTSPCQYALGKSDPKTDDYEILFYLQLKTPLGESGVYKIKTGGQIERVTQ
ncbi:type II secretion system protein [Candidatus Uhrbacteria bacterium]|nr:type II secretion system protein [Candidatus Uhrbacteria bacterium]